MEYGYEILWRNNRLNLIRCFTNFGPPIFNKWIKLPLIVNPHAVEIAKDLVIPIDNEHKFKTWVSLIFLLKIIPSKFEFDK